MADVLSAVRGSRTAGPGRSRREYIDLAVNGSTLAGLGSLVEDKVPVLVTNWASGFPAGALRCLIGEVRSPMPDGRVPLFVCPECGDLDCGAVTAVVEHAATTVMWRDFGVQYPDWPFEDEEPLWLFSGVGSFVFDRDAYRGVLAGLRG